MIRYILKNKWLVLSYLIMSLVSSGMAIYLSVILRDIIDVAIGLELDEFYRLLTTSAIFFILLGVVYYITNVLYSWLTARVIRNVREDVFDGIMKQDVGQFESVNSADYISALTNDINLVEDSYFSSISEIAQMVMSLIIAIGFMIYFSVSVAVGLLLTLFVLIAAQSLFGAPIRRRQTKLSESLSSFTIKIKDIFSGFEVIKSYQMNDHAKESFQACNDEVIKADFSMQHISTIAGSVASVIGLFLQVGVVFSSAYLIIQGRLTPGDMIGLLIVAGQITGPIQELGQTIPILTGSKEIVNRLEGFIMQESCDSGYRIATFDNGIRVEKLAFTYPEQKASALGGVNFTFEKNKKYALVGQSGCGKTTLAKVLIGHLRNYQGNVLCDEVELKDLTAESFGQLPTMVHQNVYMFDEDIEQNICLHKEEYSGSLLWSAVLDSGVSLFLDDERTLLSKVGENGANLSGGQRQRIAVARALIQNKPLLILDEGTSAVDKQTGADIERRLLARENLTLITITHSLDEEMLRLYDEIIYMEEGAIVESGSFDFLIDLGGKFSQYMFPDSAFAEQNQDSEDLDEILDQYILPNSHFEEHNQVSNHLDEIFDQYKPPSAHFEEQNQGSNHLDEIFDQYKPPSSHFDEQNQGSNHLDEIFDQYKPPNSHYVEQNQGSNHLDEIFDQYKPPSTHFVEQNQGSSHLDEIFDQYKFPNSPLEELNQSVKDLAGKLSEHRLSENTLEELDQNVKGLQSKFDQQAHQILALEKLSQGMKELQGKLYQPRLLTSIPEEQDQNVNGLHEEFSQELPPIESQEQRPKDLASETKSIYFF